MIDGKPFDELSVNGVLEISVTGHGWYKSNCVPADLESVMKDPKRDQDVIEAYLLTSMGFEILVTKTHKYVIFSIGGNRYDINFDSLK